MDWPYIPAVQEESTLLLGHHRDKLVHDPTRHVGVAVLSLLTEEGLLLWLQKSTGSELFHEKAGGHFHCGRA